MAQTATVQIEMPEMGESVTEGIVLEWHVAEGDFVNEGDTVVEISTDKVDAEVPAPLAGVITKLLASVDDEVPVGAPLAEMDPGEGEGSGEGSNGSAAGPDAAAGGPAGGGGASVLGPPASTPPAEGVRWNNNRDQGRWRFPRRHEPLRWLVVWLLSWGLTSAGSPGAGPGRRSPRRT